MLTNVLLIDDEIPFVEAMIRRLTKRNLSVSAAFSGSEGLAKLREGNNTDVVILDFKMPGMDGIATLREIKKDFPFVEVILLTGHATVESAIEGMRLGAFDYLMKPCDIEQLLAKVSEAKSKKSYREELISRSQPGGGGLV